jgi:hypothetical protein
MVAIPCMCHFDSISTRHFSLGVDCPGCHAKITKIYMDAPTQSFIDLWLKEKHNVPTFEESIALGNIENTNSNSFQKVFQVNIPTIFVNTPYDSTIKKTMAMVPCMCRYDSSNEIYLPRCFKCKSEIKETYPDPYFDKLKEKGKRNKPQRTNKGFFYD